jgi:hypothetical protein
VCQCDPPTGSCSLPATLAANSTACPGTDPSAVHTAFDPPSGWDGGCTTNDSVDGGELCDGGPCVQSLTIAPLTVEEAGCAPTQPPIAKDPPSWGTFARGCRGDALGECTNHGLCLAPPPTGFRVCVYNEGDVACPGPQHGPYTEKHVFYSNYQDTRSCSPCSCGSPAGSVCSSKVAIYADSSCGSVASYMVTVDSTKVVCHDLIAGAALGSKSAIPPTYVPGVCLPSGGPMGATAPMDPTTLCCIPPL